MAYSPVIPKLTKHWLGCYIDDELVGVLKSRLGTRPKRKNQVLFPELMVQVVQYFEISLFVDTDDR